MFHQIQNSKLIKSGAYYSAASSLSAVCSMIVGFINMRWLGPELLGIWQSVTIINSYLPIIQLGIQSGLNLEIPILLGENKKNIALEFVSTALFFAVILAGLFILIAVIIVSIVVNNNSDTKVLGGIIVVSILAILSCFRLHYIATYRTANAFDKLAIIYCIDSVVTLALIIVIYKYQYYGLLFFYAFKDFTITLLLFIFAPYRKIKPHFYKEHFIVLLKRGLFMSVFNEIKGVVESLPRVILLSIGGIIQVGLFNPALVVGSIVNLIPNQIAQFLHPQLGMKYGQTKQAKDMWRYFKALTVFIPLFLIPVVVCGWFLIPYALEYLFPKYLTSLWPIRIMLIGFIFSTTFFTRGFLITIKAYKEVLSLQIIDLLFFGGISLTLVKFFRENMLISIAMAMSISYLITYIINIIVVKRTIFLPKYNAER